MLTIPRVRADVNRVPQFKLFSQHSKSAVSLKELIEHVQTSLSGNQTLLELLSQSAAHTEHLKGTVTLFTVSTVLLVVLLTLDTPLITPSNTLCV